MWIDFDAMCGAPVNKQFGEEFLYQPVGGGDHPSLICTFTDAYKGNIVMESEDPSWTVTAPFFTAQLSDFLIAPVQGAFFIRVKTSVRYTLVDVKPDGKGSAMFVLGQAE